MRYVNIVDTTLRDGEQTESVSFSSKEKLYITKFLIKKINVDSVEVTSARISKKESGSVKKITEWADNNSYLDRIEVLGFVDHNKSSKWILEAGGRVINLLTKGSLRHLHIQLKKSPEQHFNNIKEVFSFAEKEGMVVNVYLEDWSNGMKDSKNYVLNMINMLNSFGVNRVMLCDTLGILNPDMTHDFVSELVKRFPDTVFDFHGHNDYGLAVANSVSAVKAGVESVHVTANGLGERAGNARISSVIPAINDFTNFRTRINEEYFLRLSRIIERVSGLRIPENTPVIGDNVFVQNCGVHADGDKKGGLYKNKLVPERFGRIERNYSLGKTAGVASIDKNLEQLGFNIDLSKSEKKKVLERIKELSHKKKVITREDLPYIISDVLKTPVRKKVELLNYDFRLKNKHSPECSIVLRVGDDTVFGEGFGDGQYDAFMNSVKDIYCSRNISIPELVDYVVRIPPGGKTSALVETTIKWEYSDGRIIKTVGVDSDQLLSAINATMKMLNFNSFSKK